MSKDEWATCELIRNETFDAQNQVKIEFRVSSVNRSLIVDENMWPVPRPPLSLAEVFDYLLVFSQGYLELLMFPFLNKNFSIWNKKKIAFIVSGTLFS